LLSRAAAASDVDPSSSGRRVLQNGVHWFSFLDGVLQTSKPVPCAKRIDMAAAIATLRPFDAVRTKQMTRLRECGCHFPPDWRPSHI